MKMAIEYVQNGDYQIPNLKAKEAPEGIEEIGKFGFLRENYLKEYKTGTYSAYLMKGDLSEHLIEIDQQAKERKEVIVEQMMKADGVNLQLKSENFALYLQKLQMIELEAERIVLEEMIYV